MYHSLPNKPNVKWLKVRIVFCYQNLSDLLWEKNVVVIDKFFWNLRLMAENLKMSWDHDNNLFKQWMARTIFGNIMFVFNFFPGGFSYLMNQNNYNYKFKFFNKLAQKSKSLSFIVISHFWISSHCAMHISRVKEWIWQIALSSKTVKVLLWYKTAC